MMSAQSVWLTRANGLTGVRLVAAPFLALAISADAAWTATAIFALAVVTDVGDGILARRFDQASELGRLVDHSVDAVFVTTGTAALAYVGALPALLPAMIALSFLQYALDSKPTPLRGPRASSLGRWNGIAYYAIVAVPIVRDALGLGWPGAALVSALGWLLVGSTALSMADRLRVSLAVSKLEK